MPTQWNYSKISRLFFYLIILCATHFQKHIYSIFNIFPSSSRD